MLFTWTTGSLTTYQCQDLQLEAPNYYYGTKIFPGLVQRILTFRTQLCENCGPDEQNIAKRSTDTL